MDENRWKNPNSFFLALRVGKTICRHIHKSRSPKIQYSKSMGGMVEKGRGDIYEGTLAFAINVICFIMNS